MSAVDGRRPGLMRISRTTFPSRGSIGFVELDAATLGACCARAACTQHPLARIVTVTVIVIGETCMRSRFLREPSRCGTPLERSAARSAAARTARPRWARCQSQRRGPGYRGHVIRNPADFLSTIIEDQIPVPEDDTVLCRLFRRVCDLQHSGRFSAAAVAAPVPRPCAGVPAVAGRCAPARGGREQWQRKRTSTNRRVRQADSTAEATTCPVRNRSTF